MLRTIAVALAFASLPPPPLGAACLDPPPTELRRGTPVTILRADSSETRATFLRFELSPPRLVLQQRSGHRGRKEERLELQAAEVLRIDAAGRFSSDPRWVCVGAVGGGILGALAAGLFAREHVTGGEISADSRLQFAGAPSLVRTERDVKALPGAILGGLVGLVVARGLSASTGPARAWTCADPARAASDSSQVPIR